MLQPFGLVVINFLCKLSLTFSQTLFLFFLWREGGGAGGPRGRAISHEQWIYQPVLSLCPAFVPSRESPFGFTDHDQEEGSFIFVHKAWYVASFSPRSDQFSPNCILPVSISSMRSHENTCPHCSSSHSLVKSIEILRCSWLEKNQSKKICGELERCAACNLVCCWLCSCL